MGAPEKKRRQTQTLLISLERSGSSKELRGLPQRAAQWVCVGQVQQRKAGEAVYLIRAAESHGRPISASLEVTGRASVVSGVTCRSLAT